MGLFKWTKNSKDNTTQSIQSKPIQPSFASEYSEYFSELKIRYDHIVARCLEYHNLALKTIPPVQNKIKELHRRVDSWDRYSTESGYPGKSIRTHILQEVGSLGLSTNLLPIYFTLIPFYLYPEADDRDRRIPFDYEIMGDLSRGLSALLTNKDLLYTIKDELLPILIDHLSFQVFRDEVFQLNNELEEKYGDKAWRRLGLDDEICDPITPYLIYKPKHLPICFLPDSSESAWSLGHIGDTKAIPILRQARKWCNPSFIGGKYVFLAALSKLDCRDELENIRSLLTSDKVPNDLITSLAHGLAFHPDIIELIHSLGEHSSNGYIQSNARLTYKYYECYKMEHAPKESK